MGKGMIIVITGKSATGKTTIMNHLIRLLKKVGTITSTTTRGKRSDDMPGDYEYLPFLRFLLSLLLGEFLTWRKATNKWFKTDDYYSVRKKRVKEALNSDQIFVRSLTPDTIKKWYRVARSRIIFIHLIDPGEKITRCRMSSRIGMTKEQIDERIEAEKNWDLDIQLLIDSGIPIHVIHPMSEEETLEKVFEILKDRML